VQLGRDNVLGFGATAAEVHKRVTHRLFYNEMRYINLRFTYLLTYKLRWRRHGSTSLRLATLNSASDYRPIGLLTLTLTLVHQPDTPMMHCC